MNTIIITISKEKSQMEKAILYDLTFENRITPVNLYWMEEKKVEIGQNGHLLYERVTS